MGSEFSETLRSWRSSSMSIACRWKNMPKMDVNFSNSCKQVKFGNQFSNWFVMYLICTLLDQMGREIRRQSCWRMLLLCWREKLSYKWTLYLFISLVQLQNKCCCLYLWISGYYWKGKNSLRQWTLACRVFFWYKNFSQGIHNYLNDDEFVIVDKIYPDSCWLQPPGIEHPQPSLYRVIRSRHKIMNKRLNQFKYLTPDFGILFHTTVLVLTQYPILVRWH